MKWIEIKETDDYTTLLCGEEVLGFHESWIDEDSNPDGVCLCYYQDSGYWVICKYCNYHDEWHTHYSEESIPELGEKFGGVANLKAPSHYITKPSFFKPLH